MRCLVAGGAALMVLSGVGMICWSQAPRETAPGFFQQVLPPRPQEKPTAASAPMSASAPAPGVTRPPSIPTPTAPVQPPSGRDLSRMSPLRRQMYLSALRGADWLTRMNNVDGRFTYGYLPALRSVMEGDHYLRQAGAAFALARAARYSGDEKQSARARQAVLTLLTDTAIDPANPQVRYVNLPPVMVNRLAAAGLLVLAIHELPSPADDLLEASEQLCAYIRAQQQPDGSLKYADDLGAVDEGINYYPGEALFGLLRSQQHRPAAWKLEAARKAMPYYQTWWREHKNMAFVTWQSAAFAEAYHWTKEPAFAEFVLEMNDWLCELQYAAVEQRNPLWSGGFKSTMDGKVVNAMPQVSSASYAESLSEAVRVARLAGDLQRYERYREALERCLQFITRLQYTEATTQHFADWYRPTLTGAFHASPQDGNIRIDYTQHAVCALIQYLSYVTD